MIRRWMLLMLLAASVMTASSQDRIITISGDTIACRILREGPASVTFEQFQGEIRTTSRINRDQISFIETGIAGQVQHNGLQSPGRLDISFSGGPSWLTASTKEAKEQAMQLGMTRQQTDSYYRQLKLGWSGNADAHWLVAPGMGAGVRYRFFTTGAEEWTTIDPHDGQNLWYGQLKETIYIQYAGPSLKATAPLARSRHLILSSALSAGWMFYRNEALAVTSHYLVTGNSFGSFLETGLDYFLTPRIALGMRLSLFVANMKKLDIDYGNGPQSVELPKEQHENVSALDLQGGIRFLL